MERERECVCVLYQLKEGRTTLWRKEWMKSFLSCCDCCLKTNRPVATVSRERPNRPQFHLFFFSLFHSLQSQFYFVFYLLFFRWKIHCWIEFANLSPCLGETLCWWFSFLEPFFSTRFSRQSVRPHCHRARNFTSLAQCLFQLLLLQLLQQHRRRHAVGLEHTHTVATVGRSARAWRL